MRKEYFTIIIAIMIFGMMANVMAQAITVDVEEPSFITSFFNNLKYNVLRQKFSVVGDSRGCGTAGGLANYHWTVSSGEEFRSFDPGKSDEELCSSGYGIYQVFVHGWNPWVEFPNSVHILCQSAPCNIDLYCCPEKEPDSQTDCGTGRTYEKVNCPSSTKTQFYTCPGEENLIDYSRSYYAFCSGEETITCWYQDGDKCSSRTYQVDVIPTCASTTFMGKTLYSSKSQCEGDIDLPPAEEPPVVPPEEPPTGEAGDIRIVSTTLPNSRGHSIFYDTFEFSGDEKIKVKLKNYGTQTDSIYVEAGFYTEGYATEVAQLYSLLFASVDPVPNCNPAESFVDTKRVTLSPGEETEVEFIISPFSVFTTYGIGVYDMASEHDIVTFVGLYEECLGGYVNDAGTTGRGVMFEYGTYTFKYKSTCDLSNIKIVCGLEETGKCDDNILTINKVCEIPSTVEFVAGNVSTCGTTEDCPEGYKCDNNYCIELLEDITPGGFCEFASKLDVIQLTDDSCINGGIIIAIASIFLLFIATRLNFAILEETWLPHY